MWIWIALAVLVAVGAAVAWWSSGRARGAVPTYQRDTDPKNQRAMQNHSTRQCGMFPS